ncbi:MAG: hypothetical protein DRI75_13470 [Bacteroidetes bacterium]|nr:MAG: hypothetical protein DRI75_13470 [Bacteroidota bacterium]
MKNLFLIAFLILILCCISCAKSKKESIISKNTANKELLSELLELNNKKNYFKLQTEFQNRKDELSQVHTLFFDAILNNVFNNPTASNDAINKIINNNTNSLEDSLLRKLYFKKMNNHERLFEYDEVAKTVSEIRSKFKTNLDSIEDAGLENYYNLYNPLKSIPKQELIITSDVTILMERDKADLLNIDTFFATQKTNMIFDTAANISVIRKSYVDKLGMRLIESNFSVGSTTEINVKSELALAEEFKIGDITIKNAIFMVLEDENLSFPHVPGGYEIYGIIGYPIIKAMREIHITKDNHLFIPKSPTEYNLNNLAMDGLNPIIKTIYKDDILPFQLDTGAQMTLLYQPFYEKYQLQIEANNEKSKFGTGGAGGVSVYEGYLVDNIELKISGTKAVLNELRLHIEKIDEGDVELYGNLGQDYISQFNKMILSFEHSSIVFQ